MKSVFAIALTLTLASLTSTAHAQISAGAAFATATLDPQITTTYGAISGGSVEVNFDHSTISLTAVHKQTCPKGNYCMAMIIAPVFSTLPLTGIAQNDCGATVYEAQSNDASGTTEQIQVIDNSTNRCKTLVVLSPTEVLLVKGDQFTRFTAGPLATAMR